MEIRARVSDTYWEAIGVLARVWYGDDTEESVARMWAEIGLRRVVRERVGWMIEELEERGEDPREVLGERVWCLYQRG